MCWERHLCQGRQTNQRALISQPAIAPHPAMISTGKKLSVSAWGTSGRGAWEGGLGALGGAGGVVLGWGRLFRPCPALPALFHSTPLHPTFQRLPPSAAH